MTYANKSLTIYLINLKLFVFACFFLLSFNSKAQVHWTNNGNSYYKLEHNQLLTYTLPNHEAKVVISKEQLTPKGQTEPLKIAHFSFSSDQQKVLLFTNTKRVWRLHTKGDYWVFDFKTNTLKQLGASLPPSSLMFAKFSPDGKKIAYVSEHNIYCEDYDTGTIKPLTKNGSVSLINGTFDWAYEEEFSCRDGFRWSPDSKSIAYWQIDASSIKKFYMINNTDSIYSQLIPLEYPKVGETPSACRVGVVTVELV